MSSHNKFNLKGKETYAIQHKLTLYSYSLVTMTGISDWIPWVHERGVQGRNLYHICTFLWWRDLIYALLGIQTPAQEGEKYMLWVFITQLVSPQYSLIASIIFVRN